MAVDLNEQYAAWAAHSANDSRDHISLARARQTDGAAFDMRALGGVIANEILVSNDPMMFALMNAGVRVPTTISHPSVTSSGHTG